MCCKGVEVNSSRHVNLPKVTGVRWVSAVAAVTLAVTTALMQVEGSAAATGGSYQTPTWAIAIHLATVLPSLVLGPLILVRRKGGPLHRRLGFIWMSMMVTTAMASFWIRAESGAFSGIHLFSVGTLIAVPTAIWRARVRDIRAHQQIVVSLYIGLVVAGVFALEPDRAGGRFLWEFLPSG
jgi:uncharacterized membrane protein